MSPGEISTVTFKAAHPGAYDSPPAFDALRVLGDLDHLKFNIVYLIEPLFGGVIQGQQAQNAQSQNSDQENADPLEDLS
jgi:hypothetical protein